MFAYCENNPVNNQDPTGEILITTLILIGAITVGVGTAVYTGVKAREAGCSWAETAIHSIMNGLMAYSAIYTLGTTAYGCYQDWCYLNGRTPITEIGTPNVDVQLQSCADTANASVSGYGPVAGTHKHTEFAKNVNELGNPSLRTEVSFFNGEEVPYGTKGSIRFDVMQYDGLGNPIRALDFKTGIARLTESRIRTMQLKSGLAIPIYEIR